MNKPSAVACVVAIASSFLVSSTTGCALYLSSGHREYIRTTITFRAPDGSVLANERVHIEETIGNTNPVTTITQTDASGRIALDGHYCAPITVGVEGAYAWIAKSERDTHYDLTVEPGTARLTDFRWDDPDRKEYQGSIRQRFCSSIMF